MQPVPSPGHPVLGDAGAEQAKWLSAEEKATLARSLAADRPPLNATFQQRKS